MAHDRQATPVRMARLLKSAACLMALAVQGVAPAVDARPARSSFRAGAARIDITPALIDLPKPFTKVEQHIYIRAVVMDNGATRAAIVVADVPTIGTSVAAELKQRIADAAGAPLANVMLAVTHTHNAVRIDTNPVGVILPASPKITRATVDATVAAVKQAAASLQPARAGYATGRNNLVAARGLGRTGPSGDEQAPAPAAELVDRTLGVLKIETLSGDPIAFLVNSSLEPVLAMASPSEINPDVAGVAERYVEQRYGDKPVVLYTVSAPASALYRTREAGMPPPDPQRLIEAVGTLLGEDILQTSLEVKTDTAVSLAGAIDAVTCPGKITTPLNTPQQCSDTPGSKLPRCIFTDHPTDPVTLKMGLLRVGNLDLVQADANVTAPVWLKLKNATPAPIALVSLYYGPMHYVLEDSAYPTNSYQATATAAQRGCAAQGFEQAALRMIRTVDGESRK
jgi:hypothetical protein